MLRRRKRAAAAAHARVADARLRNFERIAAVAAGSAESLRALHCALHLLARRKRQLNAILTKRETVALHCLSRVLVRLKAYERLAAVAAHDANRAVRNWNRRKKLAHIARLGGSRQILQPYDKRHVFILPANAERDENRKMKAAASLRHILRIEQPL